MTKEPTSLADCPLTVSWSRAGDAPTEIRAMASELAQREPARFRSLARTSEARIELLVGDGRSLWVDDQLVSRDPSTPEGDRS